MPSVLLFLCWLVLAAGSVFAAQEDTAKQSLREAPDSAVAQPPRYIVRCQRITVTDMHLNDTLVVTLESFGNAIAGFDLKLGTDSRFISILDLLPGVICDSCGWEYFKAIPIDTRLRDGCPISMWQAVALSKITPDTSRPDCFGLEGEASLLKLVVANEHLRGPVPDTTASIFFIWEDCGDNVLSDDKGSSLIMSRKVFDYFDVQPQEGKDLFPTRRGAPRQCSDPAALNRPQRAIEFHNGGVEFRLDLGPASADTSPK